MFSLHCVDRSGAEAVRQRKENLGRELPGHSPDPLRGNDNGRKAKRYDVKIRHRVDRKREIQRFFLASRKSFSSELMISVMNMWPGAWVIAMGGFAFSTAA